MVTLKYNMPVCTVKPLSIVPSCIVFTQVSFTFSGPCTSPIEITSLHLFFVIPSEMMATGFTVHIISFLKHNVQIQLHLLRSTSCTANLSIMARI
jgi:hypothetical protein